VLTIEARAVGKRRALIPNWQIPLPPEMTDRSEPLTLRSLISRIVRAEVGAFRERQAERRLVRVLSEPLIAEGASHGKVDPGGRRIDQPVDAEVAVGAALQAFEDQLYLVLIDGREHRDLDEQVFPGPDSTITFLRLVMLSGA
jgi:hypothetical protein